MTGIQANNPALELNQMKHKEIETAGTIASASTNTPSPLFNAVPTSSETAGTIASSANSGSSSGGSTNIVC